MPSTNISGNVMIRGAENMIAYETNQIIKLLSATALAVIVKKRYPPIEFRVGAKE